MKLFTIEELEKMQITKGQLSKYLPMEKIRAFDYAMPQNWLDNFSEYMGKYYYNLILGSTFWVYSDEMPGFSWGAPLSLCKEVQEKIEAYQKGDK
jgi:hypothetical protein